MPIFRDKKNTKYALLALCLGIVYMDIFFYARIFCNYIQCCRTINVVINVRNSQKSKLEPQIIKTEDVVFEMIKQDLLAIKKEI